MVSVMLSSHEIDQLPLPRMSDEQACFPTTLAFGLTVHGRPTTPQEVRAAIQQRSGQLAGDIEQDRAHAWLNRLGYSVERYLVGAIPVAQFFEPQSTATYEDFIVYIRRHMGRQEASQITKAQFETRRQLYRENGSVLERRTPGNRREITVLKALERGLLHTLLSRSEKPFIIGGAPAGRTSHSLGVFDYNGGDALVFDPSIHGSQLHRIPLRDIHRGLAKNHLMVIS